MCILGSWLLRVEFRVLCPARADPTLVLLCVHVRAIECAVLESRVRPARVLLFQKTDIGLGIKYARKIVNPKSFFGNPPAGPASTSAELPRGRAGVSC